MAVDYCEHTKLTKPECACVECVTEMLRANDAHRWRRSVSGEALDDAAIIQDDETEVPDD